MSDQFIRGKDRVFIARITSSGAAVSGAGVPYGFQEQMIARTGAGYEDDPRGRSGTTSVRPAYEINGRPLSVGMLVAVLERGFTAAGVGVAYDIIGGSGATQTAPPCCPGSLGSANNCCDQLGSTPEPISPPAGIPSCLRCDQDGWWYISDSFGSSRTPTNFRCSEVIWPADGVGMPEVVYLPPPPGLSYPVCEGGPGQTPPAGQPWPPSTPPSSTPIQPLPPPGGPLCPPGMVWSDFFQDCLPGGGGMPLPPTQPLPPSLPAPFPPPVPPPAPPVPAPPGTFPTKPHPGQTFATKPRPQPWAKGAGGCGCGGGGGGAVASGGCGGGCGCASGHDDDPMTAMFGGGALGGGGQTLRPGDVSGGGVSDGDYGDITVSGSGATWTIDSANLRDIAALADPGADRIVFWDDSAGEYTFLAPGAGIAISGTSIIWSIMTQLVSDLTNNVTAGGTDDQTDDWSDLTTYANDAAAIRNAVYQLSRKVDQIIDGLKAVGIFG